MRSLTDPATKQLTRAEAAAKGAEELTTQYKARVKAAAKAAADKAKVRIGRYEACSKSAHGRLRALRKSYEVAVLAYLGGWLIAQAASNTRAPIDFHKAVRSAAAETNPDRATQLLELLTEPRQTETIPPAGDLDPFAETEAFFLAEGSSPDEARILAANIELQEKVLDLRKMAQEMERLQGRISGSRGGVIITALAYLGGWAVRQVVRRTPGYGESVEIALTEANPQIRAALQQLIATRNSRFGHKERKLARAEAFPKRLWRHIPALLQKLRRLRASHGDIRRTKSSS